MLTNNTLNPHIFLLKKLFFYTYMRNISWFSFFTLKFQKSYIFSTAHELTIKLFIFILIYLYILNNMSYSACTYLECHYLWNVKEKKVFKYKLVNMLFPYNVSLINLLLQTCIIYCTYTCKVKVIIKHK